MDSYDNTATGQLIDSTDTPMLLIKNDRFIDCNWPAARLFKFDSIEQCRNTYPWQLSPTLQPDGQLSVNKAIDKLEACYHSGFQRFEWLHQTTEKQPILVEVTLTIVEQHSESLIHVALDKIETSSSTSHLPAFGKQAGTNIPNDMLDLSALNHYQLLLQHKHIIDQAAIVSKTDARGVITYVNSKFSEVSGYTPEELIGQKHNIVSHPEVPNSLYRDLWQTISKGRIWHGLIKNRKKNGSYYVVNSTIAPLFNIDGEISEYIAIRYEVTDLIEKDLTIEKQNVDSTTDLANNNKLLTDLSLDRSVHVAMLSICELVNIQTTYHIEVYHEALQQIGKILKKLSPANCRVYRYSESLFALTTSSQHPIRLFVEQCAALQRTFIQTDVTTSLSQFNLNMTIGIAQYLDGNDPLNQSRIVLANAEEQNQAIAVFDDKSALHHSLMSSIAWGNRLQQAVDSNRIVIFGQKIVDSHYQTFATEVLMRYYDQANDYYTSPIEFLEFAKKAKFYNKLTQQVAVKAFSYFSALKQRFTLNITRADIADLKTRRILLTLLAQHQLGDRVIIELVESENYDIDNSKITEFLVQVKSYQALIAIDDFGTGYSNFEYLTRIPVDIIKIDGTLIKSIAENEKHQLIVSTIVNFCKSLNIRVVAEFIENTEILEKVQALNVDYLQGYYFDKPSLLH